MTEFTRFYFQDGLLATAEKVSEIPDKVDSFWTVAEAARHLQSMGCRGKSLHVVKDEDHALALAVLRHAVETVGEVFPTVFRGERNCGNFADSDHKILYGALNIEVAKAYGQVKEYKNVKGLRTKSMARSIVDDGFDCDEEIIFFPQSES